MSCASNEDCLLNEICACPGGTPGCMSNLDYTKWIGNAECVIKKKCSRLGLDKKCNSNGDCCSNYCKLCISISITDFAGIGTIVLHQYA